MPEYIYVARDATGQDLRGEIEEKSQEKAVRRLHDRGLTVVELLEVRPRHWIWSIIQPVRREVLILFIRQLAVMINSGVTLQRGLRCLVPVQHGFFRKGVERVLVAVNSGFSLSQALRRSPVYFSPYFIGAVRIGEASGHLPETLDRCATYLETEHSFNLKLKAALVYPCVLLGACALLMGFIFTFMVPQFVELFIDFRMELPWATRMVVESSQFLKDYGIVAFFTLLGPALVLGTLFRRWLQFPHARVWLEQASLKIPLYGRQIRFRMMSQFLRSMATLLEAGVPIGSALALLEHSLDRQVLIETARLQLQGAREGLPISWGLQKCGLFPPMVLELISVGEETGTLSRVMTALSRYYDEEMSLGLAAISKLVEPVVVLMLGGMVGFLLLAAFAPIYQLASSF